MVHASCALPDALFHGDAGEIGYLFGAGLSGRLKSVDLPELRRTDNQATTWRSSAFLQCRRRFGNGTSSATVAVIRHRDERSFSLEVWMCEGSAALTQRFAP